MIKMISKKSFIFLLLAAFCLVVLSSNCKKKEKTAKDEKSDKISGVYNLANVEGPELVKKMIKEDLLKWINDPVIVNAIKSQNGKNTDRTEDQIKKQDKEWKNAKGISEFIKNMLSNDVSKFLKKKQIDSKGKIAEVFVMDYQGCNVGLSSKTSDYWQGDEAKFKRSYNNGNGAVFIDKPKFDESTKTSLVQVSLPIVDPANNKVIGAITVGVSVDNL